MRLETFFEKFEVLAEMPGAVGKLRELVLELAVTGKLCCGESVAWRECVLGDVIELTSGQHLLAHEQNEDRRGIPYLTGPSDFGVKSPTATRWTDMPKVTAQPGDILITVKGSGVGKTNVLVDQPAAISRQLMAIRVTGADPEFVHLAVKRAAQSFQDAKTGIAIPGIGRKDVLGLKVVLPSLAEQKRIVAKVDELMALCDRFEAQQQELETRHSVLTRASLAQFADAPTPVNLQILFHQTYAIAPAELRKAILTLAVQGKLGRFDVENDAQTVGDHINFQNGYAFKSQWFKPNGVRLCRNVNVSHGTVDWRESVCVDNEVAKQFERFALSEGDIVLSLDRPLITTGLKVARIRKADLPCLLLQRVAKPEPKHDQIDMSYFFLWLNSSEFVDSIDPGRSNGVPHISTKQVQLLWFVLPPLAEQRRIVAKVEQLMSLVDVLEKQLAASQTAQANLLMALLAELD
jgi:type I restriction enzyme S subunit